MAEKTYTSYFPSQVASDLEKNTNEYGLKVGKAIEYEWFRRDSRTGRYYNNLNAFHKLRLYARGEQSIQKYKDELSINGDLSYLNLDWKPVPIISKFVDIVVNGISERTFDIKAYAQDDYGVQQRTKYLEDMMDDMRLKDLDSYILQQFNLKTSTNATENIPESNEELELHMQLDYKQAVEVAQEQALNVILEGNRYEDIRKRLNYDLTVIGIACTKHEFTEAEGIKVSYVDPADLVYSYSDSPYFDDIYYVGEIKNIHVNELKKQFPSLSNEDLEGILKQGHQDTDFYRKSYTSSYQRDTNTVQLLYFNYKTYANEVYKIKETSSGGSKIIIKDDTFNPPVDLQEKFQKASRSIEVLYEGVLVLGTNMLLKWELAKNQMRPKSDYTKVKTNYSIVAPRMYKNRIESLVSRITGFADMIQLTHLKIQQVIARMVPDGVYVDADGLAEVDLGNGTNYNPQEALNMFFQTGSIVGRSLTADGDGNPGRVPIQEIQSGSGNAKLNSLISTYNYYLQMIRDVTGLNEARDGSTPDKNALVGVQKLAAANSNTATRHILQSSLFLTRDLSDGLSLRISDVLEYSPTREAFVQKIGAHNVAVLEEIQNLYLHDFGIYIDLMPDDEEKQILENNIQVALSQKTIDLEDAIDLRDIRNIKLANQVLKIRRKKKVARDQMLAQQNIQAQAQANAQAQQVAAQAEIQKQTAITRNQTQLEQFKAQIDAQKMQQEAALKQQLMQAEFQFSIALKEKEAEVYKSRESSKEDRKDERTKIQATQQSELIEQRQKETGPKKFESAGNDSITGNIDLGMFEPR